MFFWKSPICFAVMESGDFLFHKWKNRYFETLENIFLDAKSITLSFFEITFLKLYRDLFWLLPLRETQEVGD